jgi:hypothetical protein
MRAILWLNAFAVQRARSELTYAIIDEHLANLRGLGGLGGGGNYGPVKPPVGILILIAQGLINTDQQKNLQKNKLAGIDENI